MKRIICQLLIVMAGLCGCGGGSGSSSSGTQKVLESIVIKPTDNKLAVGKTITFTAVGTYSDGTTATDLGSSLKWSSSSPAVATISTDGAVTAVAPGQVVITATFGDISGATALTVPALTLVEMTITPSSPSVAINTEQQFTATGRYSDGTYHDLTATVTWKSSNGSAVTIAADGRARAIASGSSLISAESGGITATTVMTVTPATLLTLAITPANPAVAAGTILQFIATGTFSDNTTQDMTASVVWSSSAASIASVSPDGKATAVSSGSAIIYAALETVSASTSLEVTPASLLSVSVTPVNPVLTAGVTRKFSAVGTFTDNSVQDLSSQVTWSSSNNTVAEISPTGIVTAMDVGTTVITAGYDGISGTQDLTVTPAAVAGTWEGTYTIYDSVNANEIGTYTFRLVFTQSGTAVTGTSALRFATIGQVEADGTFTTVAVNGRQIDFVFTYIDPRFNREMVDIGTATIADTSMSGSVLENYNGGFNCGYLFSLTKQ